MSIGGNPPITPLLIQRLHAALGSALGPQSSLIVGIKPDAVGPPPRTESHHPHADSPASFSSPRQRQNTRDTVARPDLSQQNVQRNRQAMVESLLRHSSHSVTASAPTSLGKAAQTIVQLFSRYPDLKPGIQGREPLIQHEDLRSLLHTALTQARIHRLSAPLNAITSSFDTQQALPTDTHTLAPRPAQLTNITLPQIDLSAIAQKFIQRLQQTVQQSGMFYESHLARFSVGQGSLRSLLEQPQNQTTTRTAAHDTTDNTHATARDTATQSAATVSVGLGKETQDSQHALLIRQQLEVLANQQFQWRGEAWNHVPIEWRVQREQQHEGSPNHQRTVSGQQWNSQLRMQLPLLGTIDIAVSLLDKQLHLRLIAPDGHESLRQHLPALQSRVLALGLELHTLSVQDSLRPTPATQDHER